MKLTTILLFMGLFSFLSCGNKSHSNSESKDLKQKEIYTLPYFGKVDLNQTKEKDVVIEFQQSKISILLDFENDMIEKSKMKSITMILNDLEYYIQEANKEVKKDFESGGAVKDYFEHHIEVIPEEEINYKNKEEFFKVFKVAEIGFLPEEDDHYAVFWFSIDPNLTNYYIVVRFNKNRNFESIDFVS